MIRMAVPPSPRRLCTLRLPLAVVDLLLTSISRGTALALARPGRRRGSTSAETFVC